MLPQYDQPLFRPPSEAHSLIFQVTLGCSWNECTFCEMYTSKQFTARPAPEIEDEIRRVAATHRKARKVFLADGDALVLSSKRLLPILKLLYQELPYLERVSSYALPKNLLVKSVDELRELREAGLSLLYYGVESGHPLILEKIKKGASPEEMLIGMAKAHEAGFNLSTTNLLGIGGRKYSQAHALHTAELLSSAQPRFISFLTVMFPLGEQRFLQAFGDDYEALETQGILEELRLIVENLNVNHSTFRSNHASNYLPIKGELPEDKGAILATIDRALNDPHSPLLRPEEARGL